jgi:hypothetical protein
MIFTGSAQNILDTPSYRLVYGVYGLQFTSSNLLPSTSRVKYWHNAFKLIGTQKTASTVDKTWLNSIFSLLPVLKV